MNAEDLVALNEQIAGMARAGLPLDQGLTVLAREMGRGRLRRVTAAIGRDMQNGQTLPQALELRKAELPPYYASLATAGIRTGRLSEVLCTLTQYARSVAATRSIVIEAMAYPIMVIGFALAIFVFLTVMVLPQLTGILTEFKIPLPAPTYWAMQIGSAPIGWLLGPVAAIIVLFFAARFFCQRTHPGRKIWSRLIYSLPLIGTMVHSARLAAFVDLLALLVTYEVPLPEAMQLAGEAGSDPFIVDQTRDIRTRLEHGVTLGEALAARDLLPNWVAWMAKSGERRGDLPETLKQIAGVYRRHVEVRATVLRNVLPSITIIMTAAILTFGFVGVVAVPFISLLEGLSK